MKSVNPATGEVLKEFKPHSDAQLESILQRAIEAFRAHRRDPFASRAQRMRGAADVLDSGKQAFAERMVREMGKPIRAAIAEVEKCALTCRYFAEHAEEFLSAEEAPAGGSSIRYQPLGVVLAIMPWNFPFWQVFRFAAPALMAGNVAVLKHASNVPQCALAIEDVFRCAGFPEGMFQTALVGSDRVNRLIEDPRVSAVTLTGSVEAGARVAAAAGARIKKTVLELGGSDPFVVMPSADLERAVATAVQARIINNGQSCIAAKRFIVDRQIADEFETRFVERMASLKVGDPMDPATDIGPLATADILEKLEEQVNRTIRMGARVLLGGKRLDRPGNYFAPSVLSEIPAGSPAHSEELFGPVAALFRAEGIEDAIRMANDGPFGLGACIWTEDERESERFVDGIESGVVVVNGMVASTPALPFGGVKASGYGRELGKHGIREFVNIKTVIREGGKGGVDAE